MIYKKLVKYYDKNKIIHKFDRIMFFSCIPISNSSFELTYTFNCSFDFDNNITLIPIKTIINLSQFDFVKSYKFGVWLKCTRKFINYDYIYVYKNLNNNKLIFKTTRHDNYLNYGSFNQYNHKLIFKGCIRDNVILEYVR